MALSPEERAAVIEEARRADQKDRPLPPNFSPPTLKLGGPWTGGSLRREDIYGDDGR